MFLGLIRGLVIPRLRTIPGKAENTIFVMNLIWKVVNSEEFGSPYLRRFTTKLHLYSD
jgi:hypothetical protein|tara:strand:+ start:390 stop:563 length:174 start_codon:yes stop_codon:yes gene_type:complete